MRRNNLKGFTLAEVLITLTIIGVIAAITIPNLMQSWRRHERITQIKTAYSIIQNAVKMSIAENGPVDEWNLNGSVNAAKYILPYLKVQIECGVGTHGTGNFSHDCFHYDPNVPFGGNGTWYKLNGTNHSSAGGVAGGWAYTVKLQNGMDLGIFTDQNTIKNIMFVVDVNGRQGPTKAGVDVFGFYLSETGKLYTFIDTNNSAYLNPTKVKYNYYYTYNNSEACNIEKGGLACTRVLELNHWEFPDDYPVKKF